MLIKVENLGPLRQAEFELGNITIICGENNTGKTYLTYALYGFLKFWDEYFFVQVAPEEINALLRDGSVNINLQKYIKKSAEIVNEAAINYSKRLPHVFASSEKLFSNSNFAISIDKIDVKPIDNFENTYSSLAEKNVFQITKESGSDKVLVSLLLDKEATEILSHNVLQRTIGGALKKILFGNLFAKPFIASAERTGAAIFRNELNFPGKCFVKHVSSRKGSLKPLELFDNNSSYALPVRANVVFTRQLENISKKESFLAKQHPELINDFSDIIGGEYKVSRDGLYFLPRGSKRLSLTMEESSSAVRSLLAVGFYLRHVVQPGDMLMVDEPELNLHPENQRRVARLLVRLANIGIKVLITTHSDYIVKEMNTLIMLNCSRSKSVMEKYKYIPEELLSADDVKVYIAEKTSVLLYGYKRKTRCQTLVKADINPELGIEVGSFDTAIDEMNSIQEEIMFGLKGE